VPRLSFPHPVTLLVACTLLAGALTWVLPAGRYERRQDPVTGRSLVVAGTYAPADPSPVGPFQALVGIPKGMVDAASVIFYVFLVGGAFTVVEQTGALGRLVNSMVRGLSGRGLMVIPIAGLAFGTGGVLIQMQEELIAFVPMLLLLTGRLGFSPLIAVAMSMGASAIGASFSFINPFQVGIAQKVAELNLVSGWGFRLAFLLPAMAIWIGGTMLYARRTRKAPVPAAEEPVTGPRAGWRHTVILAVVLAAFAAFVVGTLRFGWDFLTSSAPCSSSWASPPRWAGWGRRDRERLRGRIPVHGACRALIGFARGIYVVLEQGRIVTRSSTASSPRSRAAGNAVGAGDDGGTPWYSCAQHQRPRVLTMPLLVPLSDLIGLSRQVTVLAYQYGAGLCEILTPTNGALMAMLAAAGVTYEDWLRFALPLCVVLAVLAAGAIGVGVAVGV
jgi:uncharacterized ion transporter superfamily protein YfcC